jgi:colanic acid biosynthesis glycosyl transferase WcaI
LRILIYGLNYAPELVGIGKYTSEMAEWLAQQGHELTVITTPPYYPYWSVQKPYRSYFYRRDILSQVNVIRCPVWVPRHPTGLTRLLHLISFSISSFPVLLWNILRRPQAVIVIEPSFFSAMLVAFFSYFNRFKSWLHVQDFELDAAFSLGLLRGNLFFNAMKGIETRVMRRFDRVSSISTAMVARLKQKGVEKEKTSLLLNWVDTDRIQPKEDDKKRRSTWGISATSPIVLYAGNMGNKQGLDIIPLVAKEMATRRPDLVFLLVGEGGTKSALERLVQEQGLTNVKFFPLQPLEILSTLFSIADVHLVLQRAGAADLVMPSKLGPILAAGGPIVATAEPGTELYRVIHENNVGVVISPDSVEEIIRGIETLLNDSTLRSTLKKNARGYAVNELNKEKILKDFESELERLL